MSLKDRAYLLKNMYKDIRSLCLQYLYVFIKTRKIPKDKPDVFLMQKTYLLFDH